MLTDGPGVPTLLFLGAPVSVIDQAWLDVLLVPCLHDSSRRDFPRLMDFTLRFSGLSRRSPVEPILVRMGCRWWTTEECSETGISRGFD